MPFGRLLSQVSLYLKIALTESGAVLQLLRSERETNRHSNILVAGKDVSAQFRYTTL